MKRTFLAKRNALLSSADISWGVLALACVILLLLVRLFAPNIFWSLFTPAFRSADTLAAKSHFFLSSFGDTAALALRNEQLQYDNEALAAENKTLIQRVDPASKYEVQGIAAAVVARPPVSPYDTLVLSPGTNAGVLSGMEAFGDGGVPIGIVSSVLADFSRVTLFSSPHMSVDGWVGQSRLPITVFGLGSGAMRATFSRSAGVTVGDSVFVPGPGALPLGTVVRIDSDPSSPSVTLYIQSSINLFSITQVLLRATGPTFVSALSWATSTPL